MAPAPKGCTPQVPNSKTPIPKSVLRLGVCAACLIVLVAVPARAQVDGHVSVLVDVLPEIGESAAAELRTRLFVERRQDLGDWWSLNLAAYVDGLAADRRGLGGTGASRDAVVRPGELYAEFRSRRFDVRAGASRVVWGRLDEIQPTDVVNPIDLTRFLLEGRSEARLPVGLLRGRVFLPGSSTLEAVLVPAFRASRFDQLAEDTSPFNLARGANVVCPPGAPGPCRLLPIDRREPRLAWSNAQGGARFTSTLARVDWGVSAYRGFRTFPSVTIAGAGPQAVVLEAFPRFTMLGADFETVRGQWGVRGEAAIFVEMRNTFDGGVGVDRRAGEYRIAANVLVSHEPGDTDVTLVGAADRSFARDTRRLRMFAVYDPADDTAFVRGIAALSLRDDVWLEGSAGVFTGSSPDTLGRLTRHDFAYARLKVFF